MRDNKVDSLLVIDKQRKLLGYITLEYIRKIKEKNTLVEEVMNKEPKCVWEILIYRNFWINLIV